MEDTFVFAFTFGGLFTIVAKKSVAPASSRGSFYVGGAIGSYSGAVTGASGGCVLTGSTTGTWWLPQSIPVAPDFGRSIPVKAAMKSCWHCLMDRTS